MSTSWNTISKSINGKIVTGKYKIDKGGWMTVCIDGGECKSTRGGPAAKGIADLILGELYKESLKTNP